MIKNIIWTIFAMVLLIPFFVDAQGGGSGSEGGGPGSEGGRFSIPNPLDPGISTLPQFIEKILGIVLTIAVPIAVFFIIYAGFLFVTARGNETQLTAAKKTLTWALIGTAVLLGAWVIATAIQGTIDQIRGGT